MTKDKLLPITEEWLRDVGFMWHQLERQPDKHWLLWLGSAMPAGFMTSFEDIGIEVAPSTDGTWFCWLRSDVAHRYSRFIHVRHITDRSELVSLVEALTGRKWASENHMHGSCLSPEKAERQRQELERLDIKFSDRGPQSHWHKSEDDPNRGRPLREHMNAAIDAEKSG